MSDIDMWVLCCVRNISSCFGGGGGGGGGGGEEWVPAVCGLFDLSN